MALWSKRQTLTRTAWSPELRFALCLHSCSFASGLSWWWTLRRQCPASPVEPSRLVGGAKTPVAPPPRRGRRRLEPRKFQVPKGNGDGKTINRPAAACRQAKKCMTSWPRGRDLELRNGGAYSIHVGTKLKKRKLKKKKNPRVNVEIYIQSMFSNFTLLTKTNPSNWKISKKETYAIQAYLKLSLASTGPAASPQVRFSGVWRSIHLEGLRKSFTNRRWLFFFTNFFSERLIR